jgi:hypothetical protein
VVDKCPSLFSFKMASRSKMFFSLPSSLEADGLAAIAFFFFEEVDWLLLPSFFIDPNKNLVAYGEAKCRRKDRIAKEGRTEDGSRPLSVVEWVSSPRHVFAGSKTSRKRGSASSKKASQ